MRAVGLLPFALGCAPEAPPDPGDSEDASPPVIEAARFACDGPEDALAWVFLATVTDPDGPADLREVTAFVYDEVEDGVPEWTVALGPVEGDSWESRTPAADSPLDCNYLRYSADFVALDAAGGAAALTAFGKAALD
jgi:hypothetical protein